MATIFKKVNINNPHLFSDLSTYNLIDKLIQHKVLGVTHKVDSMTKKIKPIIPSGVDHNTPWVYVTQEPDRNCKHYQMIENACGFIPTPCMSCWKVVPRLRTVRELFQLYNIMVEMNETQDVYCKCGIEIGRPWVHALYSGYFYNKTYEEGREKFKWVRALVDEQISKDVPVILKRFCTEFEIKHGNSKGYVQPKDAKIWEKIIDNLFEEIPKSKVQSKEMTAHVMQKWIEFAYQHRDPTAIEFNNREHLYTQVQTY